MRGWGGPRIRHKTPAKNNKKPGKSLRTSRGFHPYQSQQWQESARRREFTLADYMPPAQQAQIHIVENAPEQQPCALTEVRSRHAPTIDEPQLAGSEPVVSGELTAHFVPTTGSTEIANPNANCVRVSKKALKYTQDEIETLVALAGQFWDPKIPRPNKVTNWGKLWLEFKNKQPTNSRTKHGLNTKFNEMLKTNKIVILNGKPVLNNVVSNETENNPNNDLGDAVSIDMDNSAPPIEWESAFSENLHRYYASHKRVKICRFKFTLDTLQWTNESIRNRYSQNDGITHLNALVYAAGITAYEWSKSQTNLAEKQQITTNWFNERFEEVRGLRKHIKWISGELRRREFAKKTGQKPSKKDISRMKLIRERFNIKTTCKMQARVEQLRQQLKILNNRIHTRKSEDARKRTRFASVKQQMRGEYTCTRSELDSKENLRYWTGICGKMQPYKPNQLTVDWLAKVKNDVQPQRISADEMPRWKGALAKARPWKATGPDRVPNYLWKQIAFARDKLFEWICKIKSSKVNVPKWMPKGRTVLLYKAGDPKNPANYRPIACLNTCYKLTTGMIMRWIGEHLEQYNVLPREQIALVKKCWGCVHASVIDQSITADAMSRNKRLSMAWIDFAKAFDTTSQAWLRSILKTLKINTFVRGFLIRAMSKWSVSFETKNGKNIAISEPLKIKRGVLQGDCLSPLLFCLQTAVISYALNKNVEPYSLTVRENEAERSQLSLTHQAYVDDIKIFTTSEEEVKIAITTVKKVAKAIGLKMNPSKCATVHLNQSLDHAETVEDIPVLGIEDVYKYLGLKQNVQCSEIKAWDEVVTKVLNKENVIWDRNRNLTMRQKISLHNICVAPIVRYFGSVIIVGGRGQKYSATLKRARDLDQQIVNIMVASKAKNKAANTERLYISKANLGYGLKSFEDCLIDAMMYNYIYINLNENLNASKSVFATMAGRQKRCIFKDVEAILTHDIFEGVSRKIKFAEGTVFIDGKEYGSPTPAARHLCKLLNECRQNYRMAKWKANKMSADIVLRHDNNVDHKLSSLWISEGSMSALNFRNGIAVQEGIITTRWILNKSNYLVTPMCRWCNAAVETAEHVASSCPHFRATLIKRRHDSVAKHLYQALCTKYKLKTIHYTQEIPSVQENESCKILWDVPMTVRRELRCNRPDIVLVDREKKQILIIEVAVTWRTRLVKMHDYKFCKYALNSMAVEGDNGEWTIPSHIDRNLRGELEELNPGYSVKVLPIIIGACGETMSKTYQIIDSFDLPGKNAAMRLLTRIQRSAVIGTSLVARAHLDGENK